MKRGLVVLCALVLSGALPASARDKIEVMTQNQYLGADLTPLLSATDPAEFNAELVGILQQIAATDFPARAQRQAKQIARRNPHLVGLQEVWALSCVDLDPEDQRGCEDPTIAGAFVDYLDVTLDALRELDADYEAVAVVRNLDLTSFQIDPTSPPGLPFVIDDAPAFLAVLDRDVILARSDVGALPADLDCAIRSEDGCHYAASLTVTVAGIPVNFARGFVAADATVGSRSYRFVTTHLEVGEPVSPQLQCAQAAELVETLADTPEGFSLIVVGDFNSSPTDERVTGNSPPCSEEDFVPPYMQMVDAGYTDVWTLRRKGDEGFTCCQAPDLLNKRSALDERIDFIFSLERPKRVQGAEVVGDERFDKTRPPGPRLWPSDHGGVVATLQFQHERFFAGKHGRMFASE